LLYGGGSSSLEASMVEYVNKGERWTEAEDDFLRENYGKAFTKFLAIRMGRPIDAIRIHAGKLGLTKARGSRKSPVDRLPPASKACFLCKGSKVVHRLKKNEYVLLGPVTHTDSGMWFAAERTLCYNNPRAPRYATKLKADSLVLVAEYQKWYESTHAGCKPPNTGKSREKAVKSAGKNGKGHEGIQGRRAV
jgi:hypothetical protein